MGPIDSLSAWAKQIVLRQVAVDLYQVEAEQFAEIDRRAKALEAEGKDEDAARLRNLVNNGLRQLEAPRRGRPRKVEGGVE
jgi:hypothetical protein